MRFRLRRLNLSCDLHPQAESLPAASGHRCVPIYTMLGRLCMQCLGLARSCALVELVVCSEAPHEHES